MKWLIGMLLLVASPLNAGDLFFEKAAQEFQKALKMSPSQCPEIKARPLTCAVAKAPSSKLYDGEIVELRQVLDDVVGTYVAMTYAAAEGGRYNAVLIENTDKDLTSSTKRLTLRYSEKHRRLFLRLLDKQGTPYQYCWEKANGFDPIREDLVRANLDNATL